MEHRFSCLMVVSWKCFFLEQVSHKQTAIASPPSAGDTSDNARSCLWDLSVSQKPTISWSIEIGSTDIYMLFNIILDIRVAATTTTKIRKDSCCPEASAVGESDIATTVARGHLRQHCWCRNPWGIRERALALLHQGADSRSGSHLR